jgi:hypothetical protein
LFKLHGLAPADPPESNGSLASCSDPLHILRSIPCTASRTIRTNPRADCDLAWLRGGSIRQPGGGNKVNQKRTEMTGVSVGLWQHARRANQGGRGHV